MVYAELCLETLSLSLGRLLFSLLNAPLNNTMDYLSVGHQFYVLRDIR